MFFNLSAVSDCLLILLLRKHKSQSVHCVSGDRKGHDTWQLFNSLNASKMFSYNYPINISLLDLVDHWLRPISVQKKKKIKLLQTAL